MHVDDDVDDDDVGDESVLVDAESSTFFRLLLFGGGVDRTVLCGEYSPTGVCTFFTISESVSMMTEVSRSLLLLSTRPEMMRTLSECSGIIFVFSFIK